MDEAQPEQGQGESGGVFDSYLENVPEEHREPVMQYLKDAERNVNTRLQEAGELRKQWEPYQDTGITNLSPEEAKWMADFRPLLDDPQALQAWYQAYAQEAGIADQNGYQPEPDVTQLMQQQLDPIMQELNGLREWRDAQEQHAREQQAQQTIQQQISDLKEKHGDFPVDQVEKFVAQYIESDPEHAIEKAYADWQALVSQTEKQLVSQKMGQPPAAESGGRADSTPEALTGPDALKKAAELARQRLQAAREQ